MDLSFNLEYNHSIPVEFLGLLRKKLFFKVIGFAYHVLLTWYFILEKKYALVV
jgi:hypothetical protein